jgi:hypothetical protein
VARTIGAKDKVPRTIAGEMAVIDPFAKVYEVGPSNKYFLSNEWDDVTFPVRLKMLEHPQITAGLKFAEAIFCTVEWRHQGATDEIREYADWAIAPHWIRIVNAVLMARVFGYTACEKVYTVQSREGKGDYLAYDKIKYLNPSTVDLYVDENGNYAGFGQKVYNVERIPPEKTFWYAHQPHRGVLRHNPLFGRSELGKDMYDAWYRDVITWQMFMRYLAKKVNPPTIGWAPGDNRRRKKTDGTWENYNLMKTLFEVMQKVNEGSSVVLPYESDEHGEKKIDLKYLESSKIVGEYLQALNATGTQLFYGILVPPSIFVKLTTSAAGSYAMVESLLDVFITMLKGTIAGEMNKQVKEQLTADLVRRQFGEKAPIPDLQISLETAALRKLIADSMNLEQKKGTYSPDIDKLSNMAGMPAPARFDPEKPITGGGNAGRIGGKEDPGRVGEETGRVGGGSEPRKVARGTGG